jgi:tRNA modification GTPase
MPPLHRVYFGTLGDGSHADEVVVAMKADDVIEVHCHGGRRVVEWLATLLGKVVPAKPALGNPWECLQHAPTLRTASILLDQCQGAFDRSVAEILRSLDSNPAEAGEKLSVLARYAFLGRHLVTPWRVVIAGAPNVGKSSLVNALAGFQRSVVSETAGTTRDVVTTLTAIDGWPVELIDTAGLRETADPLEAEGVGRAESARTEADLVLWVLDGSRASAPTLGPDFVVINKTDLPAGWDWQTIPTANLVSATAGAGIAELLSAIAGRLVPLVPEEGAAVPFSPALAESVTAARTAYLAGNFEEIRNHLSVQRADLAIRPEYGNENPNCGPGRNP